MSSPQLDDLAAIAAAVAGFENLEACRFEHEIAIYLCARYHVSKDIRNELADSAQQLRGSRRLKVDQFCARFPEFPIYLGCRHIPGVAQDATVSRLFCDFANRRFVKLYADLQDANPDIVSIKPIGLVFNWPYLRGAKALVIHNRPFEAPMSGVRLLWRSAEQDVQLTVEPLPVLLDELGV